MHYFVLMAGPERYIIIYMVLIPGQEAANAAG